MPILRGLAIVISALSVLSVGALASQTSIGFWLCVTGTALLCCLYIWRGWTDRRRLMVAGSLAVAGASAFVVGENLPLIQRIAGVDIVNSLELSDRQIDRLRKDPGVITRVWQSYGSDPFFYRLEPLSEYRERDDYRKSGPQYVETADEIGFLNGGRGHYEGSSIDIALAGDSVLQGIGMPGIVNTLRSALTAGIYSVSTSGYGPRQKTQAIDLFIATKNPKLIALEFYAGNDATDAIEDEACRVAEHDYRCRFSQVRVNRALASIPAYAHFGDLGDHGFPIDQARRIRSESLTLAFAGKLFDRANGMLYKSAESTPTFNGEAVTKPGFAHFPISGDERINWVRVGLDLTLKSYDGLLKNLKESSNAVVLIYNPTSYEIYRDRLPPSAIDIEADRISQLQSSTLRDWASTRHVRFCDLTSGFQAIVEATGEGLFSPHDGTHWTKRGTDVATGVFQDCLTRNLAAERGMRTADGSGSGI